VADPGRLEQTRPRSRGLVSSRVSGARIQSDSIAPPVDLADVVERLWAGRWDLRGQPPHTTELLGDPAVHFVFEGDSHRVVGVWTRTLEGHGRVRGAKLHPGAARAFLPAGDFRAATGQTLREFERAVHR
jgi:hypothetical protein